MLDNLLHGGNEPVVDVVELQKAVEDGQHLTLVHLQDHKMKAVSGFLLSYG